jgi:hypothetical protein
VYPLSKNVIALYLVDTAADLKKELSTHCEAILGENHILGHEIQSFIEHSNATITGLKEKYYQLRINNDELLQKVHTSHDTSGVAVCESRPETSSAKGNHKKTIGAYSGGSYVAFILNFYFSNLVKAEPKTEGETKIKPIKAEPEDKTTIKQEELTSTIGM